MQWFFPDFGMKPLVYWKIYKKQLKWNDWIPVFTVKYNVTNTDIPKCCDDFTCEDVEHVMAREECI